MISSVYFVINLRDKYSQDTEASKKLLIEAFLKEIVVYQDRFDIDFKVLPESKSAKQSGKTGGDEARPAKHCKVSRKELKNWIRSHLRKKG